MDRATPPTRATTPCFYEIPTRWMDNDIYGHVNNVVYYSYFDTVIAHFLMGEGGLDPWRDRRRRLLRRDRLPVPPLARFPDRVTAGLRVSKLGRSSVRYEIGIFRNDEDEAGADGHFVHVFVERADASARCRFRRRSGPRCRVS